MGAEVETRKRKRVSFSEPVREKRTGEDADEDERHALSDAVKVSVERNDGKTRQEKRSKGYKEETKDGSDSDSTADRRFGGETGSDEESVYSQESSDAEEESLDEDESEHSSGSSESASLDDEVDSPVVKAPEAGSAGAVVSGTAKESDAPRSPKSRNSQLRNRKDSSKEGREESESAVNDSDEPPPPPASSFADMQLDDRVSWATARLGWKRPTPIQSAAVPAAMAGRDVLVVAPTGSGKTAAYALPLVNLIALEKSTAGASKKSRSKENASGSKMGGPIGLVLVPTRELAFQVAAQVRKLLRFVEGAHVAALSGGKRSQQKNKTRNGEAERAQQADGFARSADVVVGTPAAVANLRGPKASKPDPATSSSSSDLLANVRFVVVDEADLVLSYGHGSDAHVALAAVPQTAQALLVSATLRGEGMPELRKVVLRRPLTVKVTATPGANPANPEGAEGPGAVHYYALLQGKPDRYLVTYAMLRLNVITGKVLIFTNTVRSAFRLKLFLDQFKLKSAVLNSELPSNSRIHCVEQYNAGIFDILIATDEVRRDDEDCDSRPSKNRKRAGSTSLGDSDDDDDDDDDNAAADSATNSDVTAPTAEALHEDSQDDAMSHRNGKSREKKSGSDTAKEDGEFSVSRGVDFRNVAAVINFDVPPTAVAYTHRAGRTARAGATGTVLSLVVGDEEAASVAKMGLSIGMDVGPLSFRMDQIEAFRYRVEDCLRTVTDAAVQEARLTEIRREMLNSDRLQDYFRDNPNDLDALKHDASLARNVPEHLARVPGYLLPPALRATVAPNPAPPARKRWKRRNNGLGYMAGNASRRSDDPLRSFSTKRGSAGSSRDRYRQRHGAVSKKAKGKTGARR